MGRETYLADLYRQSVQALTQNRTEWMGLLSSVSKYYKMSFDKNVLIYVQRPDAGLLATKMGWEKQTGRYLKAGSKGIGVVDMNNPKATLAYYFDLADTRGDYEGFRRAMSAVWSLERQYQPEILDRFHKQFGTDENSIENCLCQLVGMQADAFFEKYLSRVEVKDENSVLHGLPAGAVQAEFAKLVSDSAAYIVFKKCGIKAEIFEETGAFENISHFGSLELFMGLGYYTCAIARSVLSEIHKQIEEIKEERSQRYEPRTVSETGIHERGGRDAVSEPSDIREQGVRLKTDRDVREKMEGLHDVEVPAETVGVDRTGADKRADSQGGRGSRSEERNADSAASGGTADAGDRGYAGERINVFRCNKSCPYSLLCRFMNFKKKCMTDSFDFQITNHNYILADLIGQKQGRKPLFPGYGAMVFDESHKLIDAARQMYSTVWGEQDAELIVTLSEANRRTAAMDELTVLRSQLAEYNRQIFDRLAGDLAGNHTREGSRIEIVIGSMEKIYIRHMAKALEQLPLSYQENSGQKMRLQGLKKRCQELTDKLTVFLNSGNSICWMEKRENGRLALCAVPMELEQILFHDIWSRPIPVIITSGTMSVRGDFSHFKRMTGLSFAALSRIMETSKPSPFDFQSNGLLYIPERMPFPNIRDDRYIQAIMEEIVQIVSATHGHTLILFTSYWLMERVFYGLKEQLSDYPLFLMGRGRLDVISSFRRSGNGVLFASDSAGEGIDLAGDILSSLIVVKLPFPVPDPVMEYQRNQYEDFDLYRRDIIIPEMLIKLRQWFGRGIRREKDTAVFSILDSRASLRGRYRAEILNTLPTMPVTDRLMDVADFIIRKKADSYFMDKEWEEE